jgi:hypothetical protein
LGGVERVDKLAVSAAVVALRLITCMFTHGGSDSFLEFAGFEKCRAVGDACDRLVRLEHHPSHPDIEFLARFQVEAQAAEHDRNETAGAGPDDKVEVIAWLGNFGAAGCSPLHLDKCAVHELLDDDEHRVPTHTTAIYMVNVSF